jgi:hypothetical protein
METVVIAQPRQKVHEIPSQSVAVHSGGHLSSQLCGKAQIGGLWSRLDKARPYLKTNQCKKS